MRLLIWDFDGTLAYRPGMWSATLLQVLSEVDPSHTVTVGSLRPALQTGFRWHSPEKEHAVVSAQMWWSELHPIFEHAYLTAGLDATLARKLAREVQRHYKDPHHWEVYPDTVPTLERLTAESWQHVVLTNHVPEFRELLSALGLSRHFLKVFNSAETGFEKPHPEAFRLVLGAFPEAEQMCMIGDNISADVHGAACVGLPAMLVRKDAPLTHWRCSDLTGVPALLRTMFDPSCSSDLFS